MELSVYRIIDLQDPEVWKLAAEYVESETRKTKARADLLCQNIFDLNLRVKPDPGPHIRHANIMGWEEQDLEDLQFAVELANRAILIIRPDSLGA